MHSKVIQKLEGYLQLVPVRTHSISEIIWLQKPQPNKWSKKEILGHLIDSGVYNLQRFSTIPFANQPYVLQNYSQSELVQSNAYQQQPLSDLVQLWQTLNRQILHLWKNYTAEHLKLRIQNPSQNNEGTLEWWMQDYLEHLEHHLQQIFGALPISKSTLDWQISIANAQENLKKEQSKYFVTLLKHGSMLVEYYQPIDIDPQQPHRQDELYIVASGQGTFYLNGERRSFTTGDVLFVPAGLEHRFENFSKDFATWVVFYGPDGGETASLPSFEASKTIEGELYHISTASDKLDLSVIHGYLSRSYWANNRPIEIMKKSLEHSLNFGVYCGDQQVGFARCITDTATYVYIADVFVLEAFRKKGLGKWLMKSITETPDLSAINDWFLLTKDAHGLYEHAGFKTTPRPETVMERIVD